MTDSKRAQPRKIEIPYGNGDEVLEILSTNLPEQREAVGILQEQDSKIHFWIQLALEYYRQGKHEAFELILSTCLSRWDQARIKRESLTYPDGDKDRIKVLDLLAIYYVRRGYQTKNREGRRDYFARAAQKFTEVDKSEIINKHGSEYQFHLLGRAYCCLVEGRNDQADAQFTFVLQQQQQSGEPDNIPSLLGRACIEFNRKEQSGKRNALSLYKKALQICPDCPADVRLGLGICFYKLNMLEKAEEAFSKALSIDPRCVGALAGLAVIELNKKTTISIKQGIEYLSRAFKIEPTNPMVLTLLADHFFYANEHEKVIKLANRALENTEDEAMQAQACYQLGRAYHKQKEYDNAFEYYYKATQFGGSRSFLAYYGLGQIYIQRKEFEPAIQAFETVLKSSPDNIETLKVLASLYDSANSQSRKESARSHLKKVTTARPNDLEAWIELGSLCEQTDTQTALSAYRTTIQIYESQSNQVPPEIYNNIAALLFSTNSLDESEKYYNLALKRCEEERVRDEEHYGSIMYTIKYNMGRLYEARHELIKAEDTYKEILTKQSMYIDCYLRLGCLKRDQGLLFEASDHIKETFRTDPDNLEAWTLIGNLHFSKLELTPCQKKFERILDRTRANPDIYSLLSVGNVWLESQYQPIKDQEKLNLHQGRALNFFKAALKHDPRNIYAANGIGCLFAAKRMFNEARDIFSQVREATADFPDVWINIAHIYVEQQQYAAAVQMYENCLKKFYNNANTDILLYIARAFYKANKMNECKKTLLRARYIDPHDITILCNLAKVLKTLARQIFEDRKSTYHAVVSAEYELKLARMYFVHYLQLRDQRSFIDSDTVKREERLCADLLLQVERSIKMDAEQRDREEKLRRQEQEEQLKQELLRKEEEENRKKLEDQQRKEELETRRREILRRQEEAKQKMLNPIVENPDEEHSGDDGRPRTKKAKKSKVAAKKPANESADKRFKSRAILSSDSSSSSSDDERSDGETRVVRHISESPPLSPSQRDPASPPPEDTASPTLPTSRARGDDEESESD